MKQTKKRTFLKKKLSGESSKKEKNGNIHFFSTKSAFTQKVRKGFDLSRCANSKTFWKNGLVATVDESKEQKKELFCKK